MTFQGHNISTCAAEGLSDGPTEWGVSSDRRSPQHTSRRRCRRARSLRCSGWWLGTGLFAYKRRRRRMPDSPAASSFPEKTHRCIRCRVPRAAAFPHPSRKRLQEGSTVGAPSVALPGPTSEGLTGAGSGRCQHHGQPPPRTLRASPQLRAWAGKF